MKLFSIKARASAKGKHLSGAERIVPEDRLETTLEGIYRKVSRKGFDLINIKVELLEEEPLTVEKSLPIREFRFDSVEKANEKAVEIIKKATGLDGERINRLIEKIHTGASPDGGNMRGAMIVDQTGNRIELDAVRGVRTSAVDFVDREGVVEKLLKEGFTERTADALCIATKNLLSPYILAEYCISDEEDYTTGYVATTEGYYRFLPLKEKGNKHGGRIYFVKERTDLKELYRFLEKKPVLIKDVR
ncbi:MAG: 6-carboxyhexanoate--CoA ligase [Aquificae bacterium]|nr:6-carboxyhexanoate--CoA ligase [Aquificota bacterium]